MSKAGKLVKGMVKAKKESVMGKLGDSPYEDPMEPWSAKYAQPVKEETLNEDGLLMKYIRSLGFNPEFMTFAQRSSYARSNAFKRYKTGHTFDLDKQNLKQEEDLKEYEIHHDGNGNYYDDEGNKFDRAPRGSFARRHTITSREPDQPHAVHINGKKWKTFGSQSHATNVAKKIKGATVHREEVNEEFEQLDEAGTGLLMSFIKSKGLNPMTMDGNQKKAYARSSEFRIFKMRHMKETSGMGERGEDWNEEKKNVKEEVDKADTVTMDIPLLIRVLEYAREDAKTDMDLHKVVENLINMRGEGPLSMEMYNKIIAIKEEIEKMDEVSSELLDRYKDKARPDADAAHEKGNYAKSVKRYTNIMKATGKQIEKTTAGIRKALNRGNVNELKKADDNMEIDDRITREEKKMKGADPCWKGYQMVGTKKKAGRTVPNCVPEEVVQEGIGGIEDSPMSATNSVKAMESEQRKKNMKSARIIKSIYKKKGKNESMYDWEKDDKPAAKITLQGGTTMTGKPRDTVEIEPVLKTRPNSQKQ